MRTIEIKYKDDIYDALIVLELIIINVNIYRENMPLF